MEVLSSPVTNARSTRVWADLVACTTNPARDLTRMDEAL